MMGFELMTSSLPRMRSTPELHRLLWSGKRGSNSRPSAWKADALPTELLPQLISVGGGGLEPPNPEGADLQSAAIATMRTSQVLFFFRADRGIRTHDPEITNHVLWPTELYRRVQRPSIAERDCKGRHYFGECKLFSIFFYKFAQYRQDASPVESTFLPFSRLSVLNNESVGDSGTPDGDAAALG